MQVSSAAFKANCLKYMEIVAKQHEEIIITKRGKQLVKLVPLNNANNDNIFGVSLGTVTFNDSHIIENSLDDIVWEAKQLSIF